MYVKIFKSNDQVLQTSTVVKVGQFCIAKFIIKIDLSIGYLTIEKENYIFITFVLTILWTCGSKPFKGHGAPDNKIVGKPLTSNFCFSLKYCGF